MSVTSGPEFGREIWPELPEWLEGQVYLLHQKLNSVAHDRGNESVLSPTSLQNKSSSGYKPEMAEAR